MKALRSLQNVDNTSLTK